MPELKIRLGELEVDEYLPAISTLAEVARDNPIKVNSGPRRHLEEIFDTENYLYLFYTQDVTEERRQFTIEDEEEFEEQRNAVELSEQEYAQSMRFLLRDDGYYAFQSTTGISGRDAIEYLLEEFEISDFTCDRQDDFPQDWMESFYSSTTSVRKVKTSDIGDVDDIPDGIDNSLVNLVTEAGEPAEWSTFSTAGRNNNLRTSDMINALAHLSDIDFVSARNRDGEIEKLNQNGRLILRYSADADHREQAQRMYEATEKILSNT